MKRLLLRASVLGLALWLLAPAPGAWAASTLRIENPGDPGGSGYNEWPGSAIISGKTVKLHFEAYATSGLAWSQADLLGLPGWQRETIYRDPAEGESSYPSYSSTSGRGTPSNPLTHDYIWDTTSTSDLNRGFNGTFTIRFFAKEQFANAPSCADPRFNCVDRKFRVNNLPSAVEWNGNPTSTKDADGSPIVRLSWAYAGNEPDMREFQIFRDGSLIATMNFAGSGTYDFEDKSYSTSGYGGSHSYGITALRTSSVGPSKCTSSGTYGSVCVGKSSSTKSITLTEPTQGGGGGGSTPGSTPGGSTGGSGGKGSTNPGFRPAPVGTVIVGDRRLQRTPCQDCDEFYQGSYSETLPFDTNNRFLLVPNPGAKGGNKSTNRLQAIGADDNSAPLGVPLKDRSVLMPFAGGLLLFLAAAHVRRLLRRI